MARIGLNIGGFKSKLSDAGYFLTNTPAGITITVVGSVFTVLFGTFAGINYAITPSDEDVATAEITEEITKTTQNFVEYELTGPDSVRAEGPLLTHEFHFSSGQIYVMKGDLERPSIEFENVNRQEWIAEARQAGCTIAQETIIFDKDENGFAPENIKYLQGVAQRYIELNCG